MAGRHRPTGTAVMRAAAERGGSIPSLCATDSVAALGSCPMCLVEIEGRRGTPAICTTRAEQGVVVHTQSERLARLRREVMEPEAANADLAGLSPIVRAAVALLQSSGRSDGNSR